MSYASEGKQVEQEIAISIRRPDISQKKGNSLESFSVWQQIKIGVVGDNTVTITGWEDYKYAETVKEEK